jgi:hypothetical protein
MWMIKKLYKKDYSQIQNNQCYIEEYCMIMPILSNIPKKQTTLTLVAVVFATAVIVDTFSTVAVNAAFARHHSGSSSSSQEITHTVPLHKLLTL